MTPKIGDRIYVPPADDFFGGWATVSDVHEGMSAGKMVPFVSIKERPSSSYNWACLEERQDHLRSAYGDAHAHPDNDLFRWAIDLGFEWE